MSLPTTGPASSDAVRALLGVDPGDDSQDEAIEAKVAAVNAVVRVLPVAEKADGAADWTGAELAAIVDGANTLAARMYRRRDAAEGTSAFGSDAAVYVQLNDPDVAQLLQLGYYQRPAVG